ncbi:GatB/YqeY domain-containing protein [Glutamicibacter bergerei]|uniref:GatB/YqeY domain-containing protein n=1 Tax=Glutamicibacter bergerei TaxID=256702 RepID=A0ABV9MMX2_9MICC
MDDQQVEALLRKEVATRRETAITYSENGAPERAQAETAEADFIETYLPKGLSEDEAQAIVSSVMDRLSAEGTLTMKEMGRAMKEVNAEIAGRFDGKAVSTMVRARLA